VGLVTVAELEAAWAAGWRTASFCAECDEPIVEVIEPFTRYWMSLLDGDSLSYSPTLHDHDVIDHKEHG